MDDNERVEADRMRVAICTALDDGFWHRARLVGPQGGKSVLVAYVSMEVCEDMSALFRFVRVGDTQLTTERAAQQVGQLEIDRQQCWAYDWAIQNTDGEMVAMPSEHQIENASVLVAKTLIAERCLPVAVVAFLVDQAHGTSITEFWSPQRAPTETLWRLCKRMFAQTCP